MIKEHPSSQKIPGREGRAFIPYCCAFVFESDRLANVQNSIWEIRQMFRLRFNDIGNVDTQESFLLGYPINFFEYPDKGREETFLVAYVFSLV